MERKSYVGGEYMDIGMEILNELREFRKVNTEKITSVEKQIVKNTKATSDLEKEINGLKKVIEDNTLEIFRLGTKIESLEETIKENTKGIENLEKIRVKDRLELMNVLETTNKSIEDTFTDMEEHIDEKIEKFYAVKTYNDIEHTEIKQILKVISIKQPILVKRLQDLEKWKNDLEKGLFVV